MNICFFIPNRIGLNSIGVLNKVNMQKDALKKECQNGKFIFCRKTENEPFFDEYVIDKNKVVYKTNIIKKIFVNQYIFLLKNIKNMDVLYIRKPSISKQFIYFLKNVKQINKNIKILMEIPSYPYDQEIKYSLNTNIIKKYLNNNDKKFRNFLYKYIDYIITFSDDNEIFNIKTIKISNGINVKDIPVNTIISKKNVNLVSVAYYDNWHGIDRVIRGISEYNKKMGKDDVFFHIVGDGEILKELKSLTNNLGIQQNVIFYGTKKGIELDNIFQNCDIGIGAIGVHRKNIYITSDLKSREYCSRGIPFIKSCFDKDFENVDFVYTVPTDDSPVNIEKVISWFQNLKLQKPKINYEMRNYAELNLTWERKMKHILYQVFEGEKNENSIN